MRERARKEGERVFLLSLFRHGRLSRKNHFKTLYESSYIVLYLRYKVLLYLILLSYELNARGCEFVKFANGLRSQNDFSRHIPWNGILQLKFKIEIQYNASSKCSVWPIFDLQTAYVSVRWGLLGSEFLTIRWTILTNSEMKRFIIKKMVIFRRKACAIDYNLYIVNHLYFLRIACLKSKKGNQQRCNDIFFFPFSH